jgi:hypothetical protein
LIEQFEKTAANALTKPDPAVAQELERTQQFLRGIQEQLKAERQRSEKLKERVVDLERSKAGSKIELPAISPTRLPNSVKVGNTAAPVAQSDRPVAAQPQQAPLWQPFTALPTTSPAPEKEDLTPVTSSNIGSYRKACGLRHPGAVSQSPVAVPAENATAPPILVPAVLSDEN